MAQKQKPVHRIRLGGIRAAIWPNRTKDNEVWFNVTVTRTYKDGQEWKDATSFRRDDLPIVAKVADMAYAWLWEQEASAGADEETE